MVQGGNVRAAQTFGKQQWPSLHAKYSSALAQQYRDTLEREVNEALGYAVDWRSEFM
jgi:hypothetical protein